MSNWKEGFYAAIAVWVQGYIDETRPCWPTDSRVDRVTDVHEEIDYGFGGSDVTAGDDPELDLTVKFIDTLGKSCEISIDGITLTELIRKL